MTYLKQVIFISWLAIAVVFTSCKKFVEVDPPKNTLVTSQVFADSASATAAINGIYINMNSLSIRLLPMNGGITVSAGLSSDEIYPTTSSFNYGDDQEFYLNHVSPANSTDYALWSLIYEYIYQANACIEGITGSIGISEKSKAQLLGEAKLIRAFLYFNLINLYGDVPLITSTLDYKANAIIPRTSADNVYSRIIEDLSAAENQLVGSYPSPGRVRPNKYTALALLARVFLYNKMWDKAEATATEIINSGMYSLEPDLNNVFLAGSNEAIWQILPLQYSFGTAEGFFFTTNTPDVVPKYVVRDDLLNAFENGDQRKINWLVANQVSGQTLYHPYKYKLGRDFNTPPAENYMMFRLSEQYLIRAESRAQQGNIAAGSDDLNVVRQRAGLANFLPASQIELLTAIYHERQVELFCEWGHRWYDLKRTGQADSVMTRVTQAKGSSWNSERQVYPVPEQQIQLNPFLIQNPGY